MRIPISKTTQRAIARNITGPTMNRTTRKQLPKAWPLSVRWSSDRPYFAKFRLANDADITPEAVKIIQDQADRYLKSEEWEIVDGYVGGKRSPWDVK